MVSLLRRARWVVARVTLAPQLHAALANSRGPVGQYDIVRNGKVPLRVWWVEGLSTNIRMGAAQAISDS